MQQEERRTKLEELQTLESFVRLGGALPYGPYLLFRRLAARYPLHFIQFMHGHRYDAPRSEGDTVYGQLSQAQAQVEELSAAVEQHLTRTPAPGEERAPFEEAAGRLENQLWLKNFSDPRFTHFLDIDQCTDDEAGLGIESLFYYVEGSTLHLRLTGREGALRGEESFAAAGIGGGVKEVLLAWLARYFEEPGNWSGDNHYQWSNCIARKEFDAARARGRDLIVSRRASAERATGDHELIRFCRDHHLSPRPAGGDAASWQARCPSGGPPLDYDLHHLQPMGLRLLPQKGRPGRPGPMAGLPGQTGELINQL